MARPRLWTPLFWCRLPVPRQAPCPVFLSSDDLDDILGAVDREGNRLAGYLHREQWVIHLYAGDTRQELYDSLLHEHQHAALLQTELTGAEEEKAIRALTPRMLPGLKALGWEPPPLPAGWRGLATHARHVRYGRRQKS